ncbi:altronate dehydratase family protein [Lactonifactor longoviformis]|uniref:UxaA family hydrolase n=1 Tax=Lactonifactor longoviformis TaxID=341220 RepID=UPI00210C7E2F|nr:altronate dehydratase family protein [Lactonifactor longoviformis]MCQ4670456.1 altronate dehydratase family protein [Lactonifactor longoviformis]
MKETQHLIQIAREDNVAVALADLPAGTVCRAGDTTVTLTDPVPFGHKAALTDIPEGQNIIKYGHPIGHALYTIRKGQHIHTQNLKTNLDGILDYTYTPNQTCLNSFSAPKENAFFQGYLRPDGKAGIRNEIWIIPTVGCVNTTASLLAKEANKAFGQRTDGIFAYTHNMGCSQLTEDFERTQQILKGLIQHPNAGGVLVLSLGCENNNLDVFKPVLGDLDPNRVKFLVTQEAEDEYEEGMQLLKELTQYVSSIKREKVSAEKLVVGFKCGGSDAFSGITANALCGRITDKLVRCGGSAVLTEVPEMFGAETLLMERAVSEEVFQDEVKLINDFKQYFTKYKQTIYENPSPGNKKGGISSLEEKSLGCTQKGGQAPVVGVLDYGQSVETHGLNLLTGPGNDQVSCTNLVASGAQMVLFTTGRGNPFGTPVPTVKISSNTPLYLRKKHWIDYNAGQLLEGKTFEEITEDFFSYLLKVASGEVKTQNEIYGYKEISVFRDGVIL